MFKFCPECTQKAMPGWKCCPFCGFKFEEIGSATPEATNANPALDNALGNLMGFAEEKKVEEEKLRMLIIRGRYDEAKELCNKLIDNDPMDKAGYIGLIRIASKNYKEYESAEIAEQIRVVGEIFTSADELLSDGEYAKYITARKQYFEEKERKRIETEKAVAERRRLEAEKAAAERRRREKAEKELSDCGLNYTSNYNGTYTVTGLSDKYKKTVVIPDCVSIIGGNAFSDCKTLTGVTIPNSVVRIEEKAFSGCENLTKVIIPDSVVSIGVRAFWLCRNLTNVVIPNSVNNIGEEAFLYCDSLTSVDIPSSIKKINKGVFRGCSSLSRVTIPDSVESIGDSAFRDCDSLKRVSLPYYCNYTAVGTTGMSYNIWTEESERWEHKEERSFPDKCTVTTR